MSERGETGFAKFLKFSFGCEYTFYQSLCGRLIVQETAFCTYIIMTLLFSLVLLKLNLVMESFSPSAIVVFFLFNLWKGMYLFVFGGLLKRMH